MLLSKLTPYVRLSYFYEMFFRLFRGSSSGFSDLFSEFTKHISPAFNHERPERSVQMRLYTMHKVNCLYKWVLSTSTRICSMCLPVFVWFTGTALANIHHVPVSISNRFANGHGWTQNPGWAHWKRHAVVRQKWKRNKEHIFGTIHYSHAKTKRLQKVTLFFYPNLNRDAQSTVHLFITS